MPDQQDTPEAAQPPVPPIAPPTPIAQQPGLGSDWSTPPVAWADRESSGASTAGAPIAAPVVPVAVTQRPRGRLRWIVALVVVALVATTASAAFIVLTGSSSSSSLAGWAPSGSLLYMEARLDLPGDQHAGLGAFLSAFPGFADQTTLDAKLAETYDKIVRGATNGDQDYSTKIEPWFGGQVAFVLPSYPTMAAGGATPTSARVALLASVTDATKASAWLASLPPATGSNPASTTADYGGVHLTVSTGSGSSEQFAYGVDGSVLVLGDVQTVHDVIDTKGSGGLSTSDGYKQAVAAYQGDHLAFMYMDFKRFFDAAVAAEPSAAAALPAGITDKLPAWAAFAVRAQAGQLLLDIAEPMPVGAPAQTNRPSTIAAHLPATTIAEFEEHDLGTVIEDAVTTYAAIPAYKDALGQVTAALDKVGGLASFTSLLGDSAIVVTRDGTTVGGGVVIALPDAASAAAAQAKLDLLKSLVALSGSSQATVTDATYNGATITTLDFGDLSQLGPTMGLPGGISLGHAALSYTVNNGLVVFGVGGDTFVKAVIDAKSGSSLADQPRYKTAIDAVGGSNIQQGYVDIRAIIDSVETLIPADQQAAYTRDVKPFLDPLQAFAIAGHTGSIEHAVTVLTVGN